MLPAFASEIALRKRAFASGSLPPVRAATVNSLMNFVKSFPRLASSAPFLCLIECHFECPDIEKLILTIRLILTADYITSATSSFGALASNARELLQLFVLGPTSNDR